MTMKTILFFLLILPAADPPPSPYAGEETRVIKALSPQTIEGLQRGSGLGYAKAAELNGYPGPRHVLDLRSELDLTPDQIAASQRIFDEMQSAAQRLGAQLIAAEMELDRAFAEQLISPAELARITALIGDLDGQLRAVHLLAHIRQRDLLSAEQVRLYVEHRGYHGHAGRRHHG